MRNTNVERLYVSSIDSKPRNIDWDEARGEDFEDAHYWETRDIEVNNKQVDVLVMGFGTNTLGVIDGGGTLYESWAEYESTFYQECPTCDGSPTDCIDCDDTGQVPHLQALQPEEEKAWHAGHSSLDNVIETEHGVFTYDPDVLTEEEFDEAMTTETYSEGPMMNYWYPVDHITDWDEAKYAAARLDGVSLCVVEVGDTFGLALTGGGMDFSWDICKAFVQVGALPPTHFDLPAGGYHYDPVVLAAMRRAVEVQKGWLDRKIERLDDLVAEAARRQEA